MANPVPAADPALLELAGAEGDEVHQEAALLHRPDRHLARHLLDLPALLLGLAGERRPLLGGALGGSGLGPPLGADAVQLRGERLSLLLHEGHRRGRVDERVEREVRLEAEQRRHVPLGLLGALEVEGGEPGQLVPLDERGLVDAAAIDAALGALQHLAVVAELELGLQRGEVGLLAGRRRLLRAPPRSPRPGAGPSTRRPGSFRHQPSGERPAGAREHLDGRADGPVPGRGHLVLHPVDEAGRRPGRGDLEGPGPGTPRRPRADVADADPGARRGSKAKRSCAGLSRAGMARVSGLPADHVDRDHLVLAPLAARRAARWRPGVSESVWTESASSPGPAAVDREPAVRTDQDLVTHPGRASRLGARGGAGAWRPSPPGSLGGPRGEGSRAGIARAARRRSPRRTCRGRRCRAAAAGDRPRAPDCSARRRSEAAPGRACVRTSERRPGHDGGDAQRAGGHQQPRDGARGPGGGWPAACPGAPVRPVRSGSSASAWSTRASARGSRPAAASLGAPGQECGDQALHQRGAGDGGVGEERGEHRLAVGEPQVLERLREGLLQLPGGRETVRRARGRGSAGGCPPARPRWPGRLPAGPRRSRPGCASASRGCSGRRRAASRSRASRAACRGRRRPTPASAGSPSMTSGRHVRGRAHQRAGHGHPLDRVEDAGDAEVHQLQHAVVAHHHVLGLEVAVDDARLVRVSERRGELRG